MTTASSFAPEGFTLLGISHRTAALERLERLALVREESDALVGKLTGDQVVSDAMVVSTCNRTEIYGLAKDGISNQSLQEHMRDALVSITGEARGPNSSDMYALVGQPCIHHLFRVACGLDSMIVGETQILGQIKNAYETSCALRAPSPTFQRILNSAFKVGGRSRAETNIGLGAVSVASAAVHLVSRIYSDLTRRVVAIVGAGDTARLLAEHFGKMRPGQVVILNRTLAHASDLAAEIGGGAASLDELPEWLERADVVATAVQTRTPIIDRAMVQAAMGKRSGRSLAMVDLGLPRNVATEVDAVPNVFLQDISALKRMVDGNLQQRLAEIPRVEGLIGAEIEKLLSTGAVRSAGPIIAALRNSIEQLRQEELRKQSRGLDDQARLAADRVSKAVLNKLLHGPTVSIKQIARRHEENADQLELIRQIFGTLLEEGPVEPEQGEEEPHDPET